MYEKIPTAGMSNKEWLTLRKTGIGGSDAGSICGVNPFGSPMKVYHDKTSNEVEELDNEAVRQGHDLEDYVAQRFMEATGLKVTVNASFYVFQISSFSAILNLVHDNSCTFVYNYFQILERK